jgi:oligoribonuclease NrnB/cAMP/cGMP phosphodiesterase (DHH superfamily)
MNNINDLREALERAKNKEALAVADLEVAEEELQEALDRCERAERETEKASRALEEAMAVTP